MENLISKTSTKLSHLSRVRGKWWQYTAIAIILSGAWGIYVLSQAPSKRVADTPTLVSVASQIDDGVAALNPHADGEPIADNAPSSLARLVLAFLWATSLLAFNLIVAYIGISRRARDSLERAQTEGAGKYSHPHASPDGRMRGR